MTVSSSSRVSAAVASVAALMMLATPVSAQPASISGRVIDAATGRPVGAAIVRVIDVPGGPARAGRDADLPTGSGRERPVGRSTRTDAEGRWRLAPIDTGHRTLSVQALGYAPRRVEVAVGTGRSRGNDPIEIALTPAVARLDQIVVTAARREQRLADVAVTTEVVSRFEIEQTGAADLAAVLTEHVGIQLQGGHPSGAGLMLQGIGSERVLVLLDGQPLYGRISGSFDISRIPTSIIERVEIVKGPQSTLYGSEAMGGVINVLTRAVPAAAWTAEARVLAGNEGRLDGALRGTMTRGTVALSADVGRRAVERAPGVASELGALAERFDAAARLRWMPSDALALESAVLVLDERQRWRSGPLYTFADNVQVSGRAGASWTVGAHRLASTVHVSQFDHLARASQFTKPIAGTGERQTQRLVKAELLFNGTGRGGRSVDVGLEVKQEYITSNDGRIEGGVRTLHSVEPFAQVEWTTARWTVTPGARLTWNEQWGTHASPKLALRFQARPELTVRASVGRGFRAPDFKELWMDFTNDGAGYAVHGNPDLRPEHSDNATLGVEWMRDRVHARAQLFWNELYDFIETRPVSSGSGFTVYTYGNVDRSRTRGVEVETGLTFEALRAEASWAYLDSRDGATGLPLLARPSHSGRVVLGYGLPLGLRLSVAGIYTGSSPMQRDDTTFAITSRREEFTRLDVRLAQRLPLELELVLGADNLFDARPAQWAESTGRRVYAGLGWQVRSRR